MAKRKTTNVKMGKAWSAARSATGLSQKAMAKRLGISPAYLSLIESGQRPNPSMTILRKLAAVSCTDPVALLGCK